MQIVVAGQLHAPSVAALTAAHDVVTFAEGDPPVRALEHCEILVTRGHLRVSAALLARMPKLRLVVKAGSGTDNIDLAAAAARGVAVEATGSSTVSVAELALGLLLAVRRRIAYAHEQLQRGRWGVKYERPGNTLAGSTLGIVGFGRIGGRTAQLAAAFGMRVLAWDRSPEKPEKVAAAEASSARFVSLEELLAASNAISLHLPGSPETAALLGARELAMLPPGAVLINTGRASVVDRGAMLEALKSGALAGAGLDVFHREPLDSGDPLLALPQVVCTPHLGAQTVEAMEAIGHGVCHVIAVHARTTRTP